MTETITIPRINDMHVHLRQDPNLEHHVEVHAQFCDHVVAMPNLSPPLVEPEQAAAYARRIRFLSGGIVPIVPLYLTEETTVGTVEEAHSLGVTAVKLYPVGVTTNSAQGVRLTSAGIGSLKTVFKKMADLGMILLIHPEVPDAPALAAEYEFFKNVASWFITEFPSLRIVFEHLTTGFGAWTVKTSHTNIAGTITAHHLLGNTDTLLGEKLKPGNYCKPVLKSEQDRLQLMSSAFSGNPKFFFGSDSAPHAREAKYLGAAGCYTAEYLPGLLASVFDGEGALDKLADFASNFGADFYGVPRTVQTIEIEKVDPFRIPEDLCYLNSAGEEVSLIPFGVGNELDWSLKQ